MSKFSKILGLANKNYATDIHLQEGEEIYFRCDELLRISNFTTDEILFEADYLLFKEIFEYKDKNFQKLLEKNKYDYDFSIKLSNQSLRIHLYFSRGKLCMAIRILAKNIPLLEDDYDKNILLSLCDYSAGLIIVAGQTGSGKSYTMASLIEEINKTKNYHIITLENPIELEYKNKKALIHQRELENDFIDMSSGVISALREDPDIIVIGEMRDVDTISAALLAAETGHLVFVTMHTSSAKECIGRIISAFSIDKGDCIRSLLAQVLVGIICQKLIRKENKFYPLRDILLNDKAIANLIRQNKDHQIPSLQQMSEKMTTYEKSLTKVKHLIKKS